MQILSTKIVSLHLEKCQNGCPHSDVCYLRKRVPNPGNPLPPNFREAMLDQGLTIYEAICSDLSDENLRLLRKYSNYNVTVSSQHLSQQSWYLLTTFREISNQVQISIYGNELCLPDSQKLFLVKDEETLRRARDLASSGTTTKLHFNVDQSSLVSMGCFNLQNSERRISVDSCLMSWVVNGECPYTSDYIDISHDWTIRKCPFSAHGTPIPEGIDDYMKLFDIEHKPEPCSYAKKFNKGA